MSNRGCNALLTRFPTFAVSAFGGLGNRTMRGCRGSGGPGLGSVTLASKVSVGVFGLLLEFLGLGSRGFGSRVGFRF